MRTYQCSKLRDGHQWKAKEVGDLWHEAHEITQRDAGAPGTQANDQTRILNWFRQVMGLRNDPSKGLQGDANYQVVATGNRTVAFVCGADAHLRCGDLRHPESATR
jgi:hypothetical protein